MNIKFTGPGAWQEITKGLFANKPTFEIDLDMIKNAPAFTGVTRVNTDSPVLAVNNRDTFEKSDEDSPAVTVGEVVNYDSYADNLDFKISAGMSREQLATHFGDLGKKLDEAYAAGEYSENEYNDLNSQLMESYDNAITRCERRAASREADKADRLKRQEEEAVAVSTRRKRGRTNIENILADMGVQMKDDYVNSREILDVSMDDLRQIINELDESLKNGPDEDYTGEKMSAEQQQNEDIKAAISRKNRLIDEFAAAYCATDRDAMVSMMNTVRQGGELLGGRDSSYNEKKAQSWFIEGYTPLPNDLTEYTKLNPLMNNSES